MRCRRAWLLFAWMAALIGLISNAAAQETRPAPPTPSSLAVERSLEISAADVRPHVEFLASPRLKGRSGKESVLAANYIMNRFDRLGLTPLFAEGRYFQDIPGPAGEPGRSPTIGRNVGAFIRGGDAALVDEWIILSAHYDHLGTQNGEIYRGADDNASGVAMLLEVARRLESRKKELRRSVAFVSFDLEERMLWDSRWFTAHPPMPIERVKLFITADMIGRSLGDLPLPAVFVMGSEHSPALVHTLDAVRVPDGLEVIKLGIDYVGIRSDYAPFRTEKVPFLFFSTGEHPDYHTPRDVPEKVDYPKLAKISNVVLELCTLLANADKAPDWTDEVVPDLDEARALNRIATLLLEAENGRKLTDLQKFIVSQVDTRTRQIIERGSISENDRKWLVRMAQVMLISVF